MRNRNQSQGQLWPCVAVLLVFGVFAANATGITVTFQQGTSGYTSAADTFLHAGSPTANNSAVTPLVIDGPTVAVPGDERQALLRFDNVFGNGVGQVPLGATINSATLTVNITNASLTGAALHRMLQPWTATDNWNTWVGGVQADGVEANSTSDVTSFLNSTGTHTINVTASVAAWAAGAANHGWVFRNPGDDSWQFDSSEGATVANRPRLSITYNEGGGGANLIRQPYLQLATPTSMTIVWRSDTATDSRVRYGTTQGSLTQSATNATVSVDHIVTITGLSANTKYFYDIGSTTTAYGGGTASHYFKTAPTVGGNTPFRVWAIGDSGNGTSTQTAVMNAMLTAAGATLPEIAIHLGDIAYNSGTDQEFTDNHFTPFAPVLRNTTLWPSLGNHEAASVNTTLQTGPYYAAHVLPSAAQAGGLASGTEAYYSFDYGNVHFVVLDSQDSSRAIGGPMLTWLANDLAATSQQWLIAYWHHPPYSKGSHNSDSEAQLYEMRERALPILEAAGVDLVLSGHSHAYERSYLINQVYGYGSAPNFPTPSFATLNGAGKILDDGNGRPAPGGTGEYQKPGGLNPNQGTVYVVAGHGAQGGGGTINHPVMHYSELNHGSCIIDINGNELTLQNVRETGVISDSFKIVKGDVAPRIVSTTPSRSAILAMLPSVSVTFSRPVMGVVAGGLTVNGSVATSVSGSGMGPYTFSGFTSPGNGPVSVSLAAGSIADSGPPNLAFEGDTWSYVIDTTPPHLVAEAPVRGSTVSILSSISVTFSKPVIGVTAGVLTVNGSAATAFSGVAGTVGPYVFSGYTAPAEGAVSVIMASGAIVEANGTSQPFAGDSWGYTYFANLVINEFLGSNNSVNQDEFGDFADWVEIFNPGTSPVDMGGMFLTDDLDSPQQFQIPAGVIIPAGGYLLFWCDSTPGEGPRHTNFNISRTGEDIGLFDTIANGNVLIDGFTFTTQTTDITSGRFPNGSGPVVVLASPTPGASNGGPPPAAPQLPILIGDTWKYFKGTSAPPALWNDVSFDDNPWLSGPTGIGYADGDDATVLSDMINTYSSVYARRMFSIPNPGALTSLTLTIDYDDGYVAYLNGQEVARSTSMGGTVGTPPAFNALAAASHEASAGASGNPPDVVNLTPFIGQLVAGNNVLAIQCHNNTLDSSDFSLIPVLAATTQQCTTNGECNDNNPCTIDTCNAGVCVNTPVTCPAGQTCNQTNGQCEAAPVVVTFQDGAGGYTDTVDTYIESANPGTSRATTTPLVVDLSPLSHILLRFDNIFGNGPGQIPPGSTIQSASLAINVTNESATAGAFLHRMIQTWSDTNTWSTFGGNGIQANAVEAVATADVSGASAVGPFTLNVTTSLQAWIADPSTNKGWAWIPPAVDNSWQFESSEAATVANRPKLTVTYVPFSGCQNNGDCNDNDACTSDVCNAGTCENTPISCDDNDACTTDSCDTLLGCQHVPVNCDDGNPCTLDSCDAQIGCQHTPVSNGTPCPDGSLCNGDETCQAGICTAGTPPNCDDNNPCTTDSCDPQLGCQHTPVANGTPCPNATVCDGAETCQSGTCTVGAPLTCDDGLFCNGVEACDAQNGCIPGVAPCLPGQQCDEAADICRQPLMNCQLASSQATASSSVAMDVFLSDVANVRGYQTKIQITRTSGAGTVSVNCPGGVSINEARSDYIFFGLGTTFPVTNCLNKRAASALLSGGATVNTAAYLSTYTLSVSGDATAGSTFDIAVMTAPDSALTNAGNVAIPFSVSAACTLTIVPTAAGTLTVNLDIPGLRGAPGTLDGQNVAQRNVEFIVTTCPNTIDVRTVLVTFQKLGNNGVAQAILTNLSPSAQWLAVREGHTLRKRVPIDLSGDMEDTVAVSLKSGDLQTSVLPQDGLIDVMDFAILASRWGTPVSDCVSGLPQDCSLGGDTNGDGNQELADFQAIQIYFLEAGDAPSDCPIVRPTKKPGGKGSLRIDDFSKAIPNIAVVDENNDSKIDSADIRAFARRYRLPLIPEFEAKLQRLEGTYSAPQRATSTNE